MMLMRDAVSILYPKTKAKRFDEPPIRAVDTCYATKGSRLAFRQARSDGALCLLVRNEANSDEVA